MAAEDDDLRVRLRLARQILDRLQRGWQPTGRELADAMIVEQWRLRPTEAGPFVLQGTAAGESISVAVIALDTETGWARTLDRWLVLGERRPAPSAPSASEIMQAGAAWIDRQLNEGR